MDAEPPLLGKIPSKRKFLGIKQGGILKNFLEKRLKKYLNLIYPGKTKIYFVFPAPPLQFLDQK
jgi:hypothetical protein